MAKAAWNSVNPYSGSGSGVVNTNGQIHTGRLQRTSTLTFKATGAPNKPVAVTQKGKPEFVTVNDISASKEGGNVTITGKSNSSKLTFNLGTGAIPIVLPNPATYLAGGAETESGKDIAGDPGASAEFDFSMTVAVPKNDTVEERSKTVSVVAAGGQSASALISQPAGDPVLEVSPTSITLEADGTAVAITVTSNTNWTVE